MKVVVFDMDGLLIDSERIYAEGWKMGLLKKGFSVSNDFVEDLSGRSIEQNNQVLLNFIGDMETVLEIRRIREEYFYEQLTLENIEPMSFAVELIGILKSKGYKVALATTSYKKRVNDILEINRLDGVFDYICYGDDVKRVKPNPDIYLNILKQASIEAFQAIALEDSITGATAAMHAGIPVALISEKYSKNRELAGNLEVIGIYATLKEFYNFKMKERIANDFKSVIR